MTESAEVGYWQAVVDDQRVANERLTETLTEARTEIARLREIVAAAAQYLNSPNQECFNRLAELVNVYIEAKNP